MRQPGTAADHLWKDFICPNVGVVPIQFAGERQPFFPVQHVSSRLCGRGNGQIRHLTDYCLKPARGSDESTAISAGFYARRKLTSIQCRSLDRTAAISYTMFQLVVSLPEKLGAASPR